MTRSSSTLSPHLTFTLLRSTRASINFIKNKGAVFNYTTQDVERLQEFVDIGR